MRAEYASLLRPYDQLLEDKHVRYCRSCMVRYRLRNEISVNAHIGLAI
jgi:hypothetical protein